MIKKSCPECFSQKQYCEEKCKNFYTKNCEEWEKIK